MEIDLVKNELTFIPLPKDLGVGEDEFDSFEEVFFEINDDEGGFMVLFIKDGALCKTYHKKQVQKVLMKAERAFRQKDEC